MKILAVSHNWLGANDYSFVRAFRRAGHSVLVVSDQDFVPNGLRNLALRIARRIVLPFLVDDYQKALIDAAIRFKPEMLFIYKGSYVKAETIAQIKRLGATAVNVYPDIGFSSQSPYLEAAMRQYDIVFTSKSFRLQYMKNTLGVSNAVFMPHAFDPEVHYPAPLEPEEWTRYASDVALIGTWSPKKGALVEHLCVSIPDMVLKVWGNQWERASPVLAGALQGGSLTGLEYAKGVRATKIALAPLVESPSDSTEGDKTTARTFEIPAIGSFMLHERTEEATGFFEEGRECEMYGDRDELVAKIRYYLGHERERKSIARAGCLRAHKSGYDYDTRVATVLAAVKELRTGRQDVPDAEH
jgi:spore maturation protein CgeB